MGRRFNMSLVALLVAVGAASCSGQSSSDASERSGPRLPAQVELPVSINETMVALVTYASEPLWLDAYEPPETDAEWRNAEYYAYQVAVGGKLIQIAGNGPHDSEWVSEPDWIRMADEMSAAGMEALEAAKARDVGALGLAGDRLVAACEACHIEFKPDLPSMGVYKSPDYPPRN
ncbi:MAG: hypothetical protein AAFX08_02795 [Pseudomonadota bacterium]